MTIVTANEWNDSLDTASRMCALPGRGVFVKHTDRGQMVSFAEEIGRHKHPWFVTLKWFNPTPTDSGGWKYLVQPGFVNGIDPVVPGSAPKPTKANPTPKDLGIVEADWIRVNATRTVGGEGDGIPPFFKFLGATGTITSPLPQAAQPQTTATTPRALESCDVFISVARASLVSDLVVNDATGATGTILTYAPSYDTSLLDQIGPRARLMQALQMPSEKPATFVERFLGVSTDQPEDRILIASLYFLQPKNSTNELDGSWQPFVKQHAFWNLSHAAKNEPPSSPRPRQTFFTGLAGGLGDLIANQFLALQDTVTDAAIRVISRDEVGGKFWTA